MSQPLLADLDPVLRRVRAAERLLLALDFDGTLSPIAARPEDAVLPEAIAGRLAAAAGREDIFIAVLSGRAVADLRRRIGISCILAGNHGLEIEGPGFSYVHPGAASRVPELLRACADLEAALAGVAGVLVECKGLSATVHFRNVESCLHGRVRASVEQVIRQYAGSFDVAAARKAWEIRPRVEWHKGDALRHIVAHAGPGAPLVICAGDDAGDEPMFEAVPDAISIHVGSGAGTSARYSVASPAELAVFLGQLTR